MDPDEVSLRPPSRLSPLQASVWRHSVAEMLQSDAIEVYVSFKKKTFLLSRDGSLESWTTRNWTNECLEVGDLWGERIGIRQFRAKSIHKAKLGTEPGLDVELFELTGLATTSDYCRPSFAIARAGLHCIVHIDLNSSDPQIIDGTEVSPKDSGPFFITPELNEGHKLAWDYGEKFFEDDDLFLPYADVLIVADSEETYLLYVDGWHPNLAELDLEEVGATLKKQPQLAPSVFHPPIPASTERLLTMHRAEVERTKFLEAALRTSRCSFAIVDLASVNPLRDARIFPRWENVWTIEELKTYMEQRAPRGLQSQTISALDLETPDLEWALGQDVDSVFIESAESRYEVQKGEVVLAVTLSVAEGASENWANHEFEVIKRFLELVWPKNWLGHALREKLFKFEESQIDGSEWLTDVQGDFFRFPEPGLPRLNRWITPDRVRLRVGPWEDGGLAGSGRNDDRSNDYEELFPNWHSLDIQNINQRQFLKRLASQAITRGRT